jgi:hypothetical protein
MNTQFPLIIWVIPSKRGGFFTNDGIWDISILVPQDLQFCAQFSLKLVEVSKSGIKEALTLTLSQAGEGILCVSSMALTSG